MLLRPFYFFGYLAGILLSGFVIAGFGAFRSPYVGPLMVAAISAALIGCAANTIHDVLDDEVDRIIRPNRPLPSGTVSINTAKTVWFVLSTAGIVFSLFLSRLHFILALGFVLALYSYSAFLKSTVLWGNVIVSLLVAFGFVYGGMTVGSPRSLIVGAVFVFLFILSREIIKDVEDMEGDRRPGIRTLPVKFGSRVAILTVSVILSLIILLTPLPFLVFVYSSLYLFIILIADGLLLWTLGLLLTSKPTNTNRKASTIVMWTMIVAMGALACAGVGA